MADSNRSQKQKMVETLRTDYSVRQICDVLGFHRSSLYYHPNPAPFEQALRSEIQKLAARYPTYGYRRITQLSDQGVQYLSTAYISTLTRHGIEISLAHRGHPWENGYAERLIRTLKEEEVHLNDYGDIIEAKKRIGHFITQVYNQKRPHAALGYLTPVEFEQKHLS